MEANLRAVPAGPAEEADVGRTAPSFEEFYEGSRAPNSCQAIGELTEAEGQQPDINIRSGGVTVRLVATTPDHQGVTRGHVELAGRISALAGRPSAKAQPSEVQTVMRTVAVRV